MEQVVPVNPVEHEQEPVEVTQNPLLTQEYIPPILQPRGTLQYGPSNAFTRHKHTPVPLRFTQVPLF